MTFDGPAAGPLPPAPRAGVRGVTEVSAFYLLYFAGMACVTPFQALYYQGIGLNGLQTGILLAIPPLVMPLVSVIWGLVSDTLRGRTSLLAIATLGTVAPMMLLPLSRNLGLLIALTFLYAAFAGPIVPLADSAALEAAAASGRDYGRMRLWGSAGYVLGAWALGLVIERSGLHWLFYGYSAMASLGLVAALRMPPRRRMWSGRSLSGLRLFLRDGAFWVFLASVFFLSSAIIASENYFGLYVADIGGGPNVIGLAVAIAAASEVPAMLISGTLARRFSARGLYVFGFAVYVLRFLLYSVITTPHLMLVVQALQGISYAGYFVGGVLYTEERAPEGLSATAQALFSGTAYGVGAIAGSLAGGFLYDRVGMINLFRICFALSAVTLAVFLLASSRRPARRQGAEA